MNKTDSRTILIVDDEPDVRFVLKVALQKQGFLTEEATNGLEALEKIAALIPDAVLLDIMMPKMDGISVNQKLKENPKTRDIPVVIITGKGQMKELLDLRQDFKVVAYLEKPFPISVLVDKLKEILAV
ncbi:MAG: response regulator [Elusimicrobia bacterium]|nr:response regulator [Elusimicrobiota bacterium]